MEAGGRNDASQCARGDYQTAGKAAGGADRRLATNPRCAHCVHLLKDERAMEQIKKTDVERCTKMEHIEQKQMQGKLSLWEEQAALPPTNCLCQKALLGTKEH